MKYQVHNKEDDHYTPRVAGPTNIELSFIQSIMLSIVIYKFQIFIL